jgi:glycerol-3-phosphate acyltransferase PlsY
VLGFHVDNGRDCLLWIGVGLAAILGHAFSIFLKFHGGKGVATSAGIMLGIYPYFTFAGLIAIAIWVVIFLITRYVSVASIIGALSFAAAFMAIGLFRGWPITDAQLPLSCLDVAIPLLIIYKHRGNIARLRAGTELRFAPKSNAN